MNGDEVFGEIAHDLRGSIGSLRLVMTSLLHEEDADQRRALITLADEEALRIAAGLAALPALGLAATDRSAPVAMMLAPALAEAARSARRYGVSVSLTEPPPVQVVSRPPVFALALPALMLLAGGTGAAIDVRAGVQGREVVITCSGGPLWPQARTLSGRLADAIGGTAAEPDGGIHVTLGLFP